MKACQIQAAAQEYDVLRKELEPVVDGFGFKDFSILMKLKNGEEWMLAELHVKPEEFMDSEREDIIVRGVGRFPSEDVKKPARWFSVHFDPEQIVTIEFETIKG